MKRTKVSFLLIPLLTTLLSGCGCSDKKPDPSVFNLSYQKNNGKYYVEVSKYNHTFSTKNGSFGVRFDETAFSATDPVYGHYDSVNEIEGGLLAKGEIVSEGGTKLEFNDYYRKLEDRVTIDRKFEIKEVGYELGFMVEQKWTDGSEGNIFDKEWFIPSNFYVTGEHDFSQAYAKMYFNGELLMVPSDSTSSLLVSSYKDKFSFSMLDRSSGYRETSIDDIYTSEGNYLHINEAFNFAGIELKSEETDNVSLNFVYPAYTNRQKDTFIYRMLPVTQGLTRHLTYDLMFDEYETYDEMYVSNWRKAYSSFEYIDQRYKLNEVYKTLLDYIKKSYSAHNAWGDVPQFMTLSDHYVPDSGFLYRNLEMGMYMLKYGYENNDEELINNALNVINFQIDNDCIDTSITAYPRDNSVFKRVLFDGLASTVDLYEYLIASKYNNKELEDKLFSYISKKAYLYRNDECLLSISFYSRLYRLKNSLFQNYDTITENIAKKIMASIKEYAGYYGAIENDIDLLSCAEDYMLFLRGFMNLFERDYNKVYLDECVHIANYLETFNLITPMNMNPVGNTGAELTASDTDRYFHSGFIGNERFLGYGYAFNNSNHGILDCPTSSTVVEYFKLYKYTNDIHFKKFAEMKFINSLLYVNMGDKVGYMDDPLHSSGEGFINEFAGNTTTRDTYADGGIRGAVHDACIGWNVYELLYGFDYLSSINYEGLNEDASLVHNLAKYKVLSSTSDELIHNEYLMTDGIDSTYYVSKNDSEVIIDLNEQCHVDSVDFSGAENITVSLSNDNASFTPINNLSSINRIAKYVKLSIPKDTQVKELAINGYPVKYINLAANATVDETQKAAVDKSNYSTIWNGGSTESEATLLLDFGSEHEIYETAIMFKGVGKVQYKIEVSSNGTDYSTLFSDSGTVEKSIFVNQGYGKGRFVKLTLQSSSFENYLVKDFKVLGN